MDRNDRARLGRLEFEALAALAQLAGGCGTGQQIRDRLTAGTGHDYNLGAIYTTLARMEAKGFTEVGAPEGIGRRPRKTHALTAAGRIALCEETDLQTQLLAVLRPALDRLSAPARRGEPAAIPNAKKTTTMSLSLRVENNNKFVRGRKRAREDIEHFPLRHYGMKKLRECEYELTFTYETDEELERQIDDLLREIYSAADSRYCFVKHDLRDKGSDRYW